jgi:hypothetical protein
VISVRKPRLPKLTPRIGTPDPASPIQSAMPSSVPSPPSTSTIPTPRARACLSATIRDAEEGISVAVSVSKIGVTPRSSSHFAISTRWVAAALRCALAMMPTRVIGFKEGVVMCGQS